MTNSQGHRFRATVASNPPLQIPGAINAYCALLAERAGFEALYLSGAGVANASFGMPDLAVTSMNDVLEDVRRITGASYPYWSMQTPAGGQRSMSHAQREK